MSNAVNEQIETPVDQWELTCGLLRQILDYDPITGIFSWKARPLSMFNDGKQSSFHNWSTWNGAYAGKKAGSQRAGKLNYVIIRAFKKDYYAHRLAWLYMTGVWPVDEIDHRDLEPSNNAWHNLREATRCQNNSNRGIAVDNISGLKGVYFHKKANKWCAEIKSDGIKYYLGLFLAKEDAYRAYTAKALDLHGKFARLS